MSLWRANDVLMQVALALIEPVVNTTLNTAIAAGTVTITPGSMVGIYNGAQLVAYGAEVELVTASNCTATTFDATFAYAHSPGDMLLGATFPKGQTTSGQSLFGQTEVLGYLADVQNDFLLRVNVLYAIATKLLQAKTQFYDQPADCIRVERISIDGSQLYDTTQVDLDLLDPSWRLQTDPRVPTHFYQDQMGSAKYGFKPIPQVGTTASIWYSQRAPESLALSDFISVPDIFWAYLKWGVLSRCFSKEGEQSDPLRAEYCDRRYKLGIHLGLKFLFGMQPGMRLSIPVAFAFNPWALPTTPEEYQQAVYPTDPRTPQGGPNA